MSPKIPGSLVGVAFLLEQVTVEVKNIASLQFLGRSDWFQWSLATLSAVAVSYGIFLSLYGLARCPEAQRQVFALIHVIGLLIFSCVTGTLIYGYVVFSRIVSLDVPNALPKLVESSRTADSEVKRGKMARNAYDIYGVSLAYQTDDGHWIQYAPIAKDIELRAEFARADATKENLKENIIGGQLKQLPFLIAMNLGTFILTFLVGALWLAWRRPLAIISS